MLTVGIDPDTHCVAVGLWADGKPEGALSIKAPAKRGVVGQDAVLRIIDAIVEAFPSGGAQENDIAAIAVEAQTLKRSGIKQHKRPQDIVTLGNVAGAICAAMRYAFPKTKLYFPTPERWKGQIPKAVMQARLYEELGWGYRLHGGSTAKRATYAQPIEPAIEPLNSTAADWKHLGDALLLARWAANPKAKTR